MNPLARHSRKALLVLILVSLFSSSPGAALGADCPAIALG